MLVPRQKLESHITAKCMKIATDKNRLNTIYDDLLERYNMPAAVSFDILTLKSDCSHVSEYILFCLLSVIDESIVSNYFTDEEILYYSKTKYVLPTVKFPLQFKVRQVSQDQWIGGLTATEFAKMHEAKIINYDPNTQRSLKKIVRGENVFFTIDINPSSVREIKASLKNGTYIPDPLTLNIPEEDDSVNFTYKDGVLTIKSLKYFNIIDGYHRLVAIDQICNEDPDFDYPMEIRITNFAEEKAQQFIFQQDQKTKMRKIDSDSLNKNSVANDIVKRLNEDSGCDLFGLISRNNGHVSFPEMAAVIHFFFKFKSSSANSERLYAVKTSKTIKQGINNIIVEYPELLEVKWSKKTIFSVISAIYNSMNDSVATINLYEEYSNRLDDISDPEFDNIFSRGNLRKLYKFLTER